MNKGRKPHPHVTRHERDAVMRAINTASALNMPITLGITIHWALAGGTGTWRERHARLMERWRHWIARQGACWACIVTHERTPEGKDCHSHYAIHWPSKLPISRLGQYLLQLLATDEPGVLTIKRCCDYRMGAAGWGRYITKALAPAAHTLYRTPLAWRKPQGTIVGKRVSISRTINQAALDRHLAKRRRLMAEVVAATPGIDQDEIAAMHRMAQTNAMARLRTTPSAG